MKQSEKVKVLAAALRDLVRRCDSAEGVRADGSNIQTMRAHAALEQTGEEEACTGE